MLYKLLSTVFGVVCVALFIWILILKFRAAHSRNYFALVGLSAAVSTVTLSLMILSGGPWPWEIIGNLSTPWGVLQFRYDPLDWSDKALIVILTLALLWFILKIHQQWNPGQLSEAQFARQQANHLRNSVTQMSELIADVVEALKNRSLIQAPRNVDKIVSAAKIPVWLENRTSSDFRNLALELVILSGMPYVFDPDSGHVETHQVYIGINKDNGDQVYLFYSEDSISAAEANKKIAFLSDYMKKRINGEFIFIYHSINKFDYNEKTEFGSLRIVADRLLLDGLVRFDAYAADIKYKVTRQGLHRSTETISDVYVDLHCQVGDVTKSAMVHDVLATWAREATQHQLALLGDYGMGKSTSCLMFCHKVLSGELDVGRIPIFIELRGSAPSALDQLEILGAWAAKYGINARALMRLHDAGRLIIIFEGFDEMAFSGTRESRLDHFASLWRFNGTNSKIIFTGRPNFFVYDEIRETLGMDALEQFQPGCRPCRLLPFDKKQVKDALRWVSDEGTKTGIVAKFHSDPSFRDVAGRPSLLFIVARMWKDSVNPDWEFSNSSKIINKYMEFINSRQDEKRREPSGEVVDPHKFMGLRRSERMYFTRGIAVAIAAKGWSNQISATALQAVIKALYDALPQEDIFPCLTPGGEPRTSIRKRFSGDSDDIERIVTEVRTFGLLVQDASGVNAYQFSHKSFFEVLVAQEFVDQLENCQVLPAFRIMDITEFLSNPVTTKFIAEIILEKWSAIESRTISLSEVLTKISGSRWSSMVIRFSVLIECVFDNTMYFRAISLLIRVIFQKNRKNYQKHHVYIAYDIASLFIISLIGFIISLTLSLVTTHILINVTEISEYKNFISAGNALMFSGIVLYFMPTVQKRNGVLLLWSMICSISNEANVIRDLHQYEEEHIEHLVNRLSGGNIVSTHRVE